MSLKILIAGCAKEEKPGVAASVKKAFTDRPSEESWSVSLVRIANQWSVEIDGPEPRYKGLSFVASGDLTGSLRNALGNAGRQSTAPSGGGPAAPGSERKDRHHCEQCSAAFEVIYAAAPGEPQEVCPVACPQCWHVNHVPIAEAAGATGDYRAESVG